MPERVGRIAELWRYPVKSMVGERLSSATLGKDGLLGDRYWAVREDDLGQLTVVRRTPRLLQCRARYAMPPEESGDIPPIVISLPDGSELSSSDPHAQERLSDFLGKAVSLWPLQPKSNWRHYRLAKPAGAREMKRQFASRELPDFSSIPLSRLAELMLFTTPLGRYHDIYPLHILSTNALHALRELEPEGDFCVERFRPNLLIESASESAEFDDFSWVNGELSVGEVLIRCESRTVRCSAPAQPQADLAKDSRVLKTIEAATGRHLGINATIVRGGCVKLGDDVYFEPGKRAPKRQLSSYDRLRNRVLHAGMELTDTLSRRSGKD